MSRTTSSFCAAFIAAALVSVSAYAQTYTSVDTQQSSTATAPPSAQPATYGPLNTSTDSNVNPGWWKQTTNSILDRLDYITNNGSMELYVPGYSYHGRGTYTRERIDELNEEAWGIGGGRTIRNASGNDESVYFLAFADSHSKPELHLGYAYEWVFGIPKTPLEISAGYTAMLMSRADYFHHFPFPMALPLAGIGTKKAKLMFSYVPRLSKNKGNGDVLFIFTRFQVD
ncbi:hypothetical protein [Glaciimonas soli]|uniref:Lipid A palmitoyltransferase PagP n=1 Tax=Glaciimonas soli TaxID=2590999 RepID=A0A843YSN1_9BURK|nr:hypothetical protein [Glaciimonas soli]MQR00361.1 hypothetical protein [Glaciimonas soli]